MFKKILVALDHSKADGFLLPRIKELARLTGAELLLLHVSTGWAAQWQDNLNLSDSKEIKEDRNSWKQSARNCAKRDSRSRCITRKASRRGRSLRRQKPNTAT